ncbi:hypothetical protein BT96DRAFT_1023706 [Gymnopus androsaceus JB14]|uniref:Uncharacterized protein n=1 Tax=Gymnopus androsaceus JB14 TaxID=1447944 RepID=A0A6A4H396_9AGAR|nr:hypothetical protein BT96DRAFT_1023706 [Gymnopus androsaceus JB14]
MKYRHSQSVTRFLNHISIKLEGRKSPTLATALPVLGASISSVERTADSSSQSSIFDILPLEICLSIISLTDTSTLLKLCLVNTEFSNVATESLYSSVTLVYDANAELKIRSFIGSRHLHIVRSLEFKGRWVAFWPTSMGQTNAFNPRDILLRLPSLESLFLGYIPLACDVYPKREESPFQLRELHVEHCDKYQDTGLTKLEELEFRASCHDYFQLPSSALPNLKSFDHIMVLGKSASPSGRPSALSKCGASFKMTLLLDQTGDRGLCHWIMNCSWSFRGCTNIKSFSSTQTVECDLRRTVTRMRKYNSQLITAFGMVFIALSASSSR